MATQRQQRPARNRRQLSAAAPPVIPVVSASFTVTGGATILLHTGLISQPPTGPGTPVPTILQGIPAVRRSLDGSYPTAATISNDGLTITLTYASPAPTADDTFTIGPQDPAVRTATGGFLAPGILRTAALPPTLIEYTVTAPGDNTLIVSFASGPPAPFLWEWRAWFNDTINTAPVSVSATGSTITLDYGAPCAVGNSIHYPPYLPESQLVAWQVPAPGPHVAA